MRQPQIKPVNYSSLEAKIVTGGHDENVTENAANIGFFATNPPHSEYEAKPCKPLITADTQADMRQRLLQAELVPVGWAASVLDMDTKRFLGFCMRNKVGDPISDGREVYGWSCATLAARTPIIKDVAL